MAKAPDKHRFLSIIQSLRGNPVIPKDAKKTVGVGSDFTISTTRRDAILRDSIEYVGNLPNPSNNGRAGLDMLLRDVYIDASSKKIENKQILQQFPDIKKAARLVIASTFSPTDLNRSDLKFSCDIESLSGDVQSALAEEITSFFQDRLNLKTVAPRWAYTALFEAGATVLCAIPAESFADMLSAEIGTESLSTFSNRMPADTWFGFTNRTSSDNGIGIESLESDLAHLKGPTTRPLTDEKFRTLISSMVGIESLELTDNASILAAPAIYQEKKAKQRKSKFARRNGSAPKTKEFVSVNKPKSDKVSGNPIFIEIPMEAAAVLHPPGDPEDVQAILVPIDENGMPISSDNIASTNSGKTFTSLNRNSNNIFSDVYQAYGLANDGTPESVRRNTMYSIYQNVIAQYVKNKAVNAGFSGVDIGSVDAVFRCMFNRYLASKKTRLLLIPREFFTYFAYEVDDRGIGVSRLEGAKLFLAMRMAVLTAQTLASLRDASDKRSITVSFTEDAMAVPESVYARIITEYVKKSTVAFDTVDPNAIQSSMAARSVSIKGQNIPGFQQFDIENEPDQRTSAVNFDPSLRDYFDKQTNNAMRVPASAMQSLDENEFARALTTTNLFFSMDISMDQDIVIEKVTDFCRKYARYSQEFRDRIAKHLPNKKSDTSDVDAGTLTAHYDEQHNHTIDEVIDHFCLVLPKVNIAPTKSQFDILDSMITSVSNMINTILPDDIAGNDQEMQTSVRVLRGFLVRENLRSIMENSGMDTYQLPGDDFVPTMQQAGLLQEALKNMGFAIKSKTDLNNAAPAAGTDVQGY